MPCTKCRADFNLLTWKMKCYDCEQNHCTRCLRKMYGSLYCEKCAVLNKRPPDREKLMELRSKDLRDYLNKNHVSTHGLVEKAELVELFYRRAIPVRSRRSNNRLSSIFSDSVPNLASHSQDHIDNIRTNIGSNITNVRTYAESALHNLGVRVGASGATTHSNSNSPRAETFVHHNHTYFNPQFPNGQQNYAYVYSQAVGQPQYAPQQPPRAPPPQSAPTNSYVPVPPRPETVNEPTVSESPHKYPKLSDFKKVEELSEISVKQLKELLTLNRVDYKGCVEKTELLDRATRLWQDNNQYKQEDLDEAPVDSLCKICMDAPLDCVILECGHMATCVDCGKRLAECPICRQFVTRIVRTFKA